MNALSMQYARPIYIDGIPKKPHHILAEESMRFGHHGLAHVFRKFH
jgi:hypothetical protein